MRRRDFVTVTGVGEATRFVTATGVGEATRFVTATGVGEATRFVTATSVTVTKPGRFLQRTLANMGTTARKRRYNREVASYAFYLYGESRDRVAIAKRTSE